MGFHTHTLGDIHVRIPVDGCLSGDVTVMVGLNYVYGWIGVGVERNANAEGNGEFMNRN